MIAKIEGILESLDGGSALVRIGPGGGVPDGGLTYEVLLPAYATARLGGAIGQQVTLWTLYFIESQSQGSTMTPRLAGFLTIEDQRFFELFTTCKGIGYRRALRAMALETARLAAAIADGDVALLQSLPEIGRRTADTIVATLRGKLDRFVSASAFGQGQGDHAAGAIEGAPSPSGVAREALEVLLQLGENRADAVNWIDQAMHSDEESGQDAQRLVAAVYRLRSASSR